MRQVDCLPESSLRPIADESLHRSERRDGATFVHAVRSNRVGPKAEGPLSVAKHERRTSPYPGHSTAQGRRMWPNVLAGSAKLCASTTARYCNAVGSSATGVLIQAYSRLNCEALS